MPGSSDRLAAQEDFISILSPSFRCQFGLDHSSTFIRIDADVRRSEHAGSTGFASQLQYANRVAQEQVFALDFISYIVHLTTRMTQGD